MPNVPPPKDSLPVPSALRYSGRPWYDTRMRRGDFEDLAGSISFVNRGA
jgi:hypothetical protein